MNLGILQPVEVARQFILKDLESTFRYKEIKLKSGQYVNNHILHLAYRVVEMIPEYRRERFSLRWRLVSINVLRQRTLREVTLV